MASIKQKNTKIEILVFRELRRRKIHFQKHYKKVVGSPDIAIPSKKIAIFIDGDFWHGYRYKAWRSRLTSSYWTNKIERNMKRDQRTFRTLRRKGWKVLRIWEHQIKRNFETAISKIEDLLN